MRQKKGETMTNHQRPITHRVIAPLLIVLRSRLFHSGHTTLMAWHKSSETRKKAVGCLWRLGRDVSRRHSGILVV